MLKYSMHKNATGEVSKTCQNATIHIESELFSNCLVSEFPESLLRHWQVTKHSHTVLKFAAEIEKKE